MTYAAPVRAMQYLLKYAADLDDVISMPAFSEVSDELVTDIRACGATFSEEILAPINRNGDLNPAELKGDDVFASPGFKEAYQAFVEAGWLGLSVPEAQGGAGMPSLVSVAVNEMIYASNMAFGLCPMLTSSAAKAIEAHASDELKQTYLPKMIKRGRIWGRLELKRFQTAMGLTRFQGRKYSSHGATMIAPIISFTLFWRAFRMRRAAQKVFHCFYARNIRSMRMGLLANATHSRPLALSISSAFTVVRPALWSLMVRRAG